MKVVIEFEVDNAAFVDYHTEAGGVARVAADWLDEVWPPKWTDYSKQLRDSNGNHVGEARIEGVTE